MSIQQLHTAVALCHSKHQRFRQFDECFVKRTALGVMLKDLPSLVTAFKKRKDRRYNELVTLLDTAPTYRLANSCEAITNCVYGMAEIAAQFGNSVSRSTRHKLPASFHEICKRSKKEGSLDPDVLAALGDLQWYERVREARTEWAHFSSAYVAPNRNGEPVFVIRCYRRRSDQIQIPTEIACTIPELSKWAEMATECIDGFCRYLMLKFVVPSIDLAEVLQVPELDENGYPRIDGSTGYVKIREQTIGEYRYDHCVTIPGYRLPGT